MLNGTVLAGVISQGTITREHKSYVDNPSWVLFEDAVSGGDGESVWVAVLLELEHNHCDNPTLRR